MSRNSEPLSYQLQFLAEDYFIAGGTVEFNEFAGRLAGLVWLHETMAYALKHERESLQAARITGTHRMPGWAGECDMLLDESLLILKMEVRPTLDGVIILSGTAAIESLTTSLLDRPEDAALHTAGLQRKIRELRRRWADVIDGDQLQDDVAWLARRRNSFAHRLIDELPHGEIVGTAPLPHTFDVEEALVRIGTIGFILQKGWEAHLDAMRR